MRDYRERLRVPGSWWLLAALVAALLGGELYAGLGGLTGLTVVGILAAGSVLALLAWGTTVIEVADGKLQAGGAVLPLRFAREVATLDDKQFASLRGPRADPAAHLMLRPYLKRAVYIAVSDPAGRTPYWLVGTRRPAQLAAAIRRYAPAQADDGGSAGPAPRTGETHGMIG